MKSGKKKLLNFLLIFGTLGIVLFFSFQNQSFEEVLGAVSAMDLRWILLCIVFYLGFLVADSLSIQYFLRRQGYRVTWGYGFFVSVAGQYYSNITPGATGGQPMQVYYLHQRYIPTGVATSALVVRFFSFQLMLSVIGTVLWIGYGPFVAEHLGGHRWILIMGYVYNVASVSAVVMLSLWRTPVRKVTRLVVKLGHRLRFIRHPEETEAKWLNAVETFHESIAILTRRPLDLLVQLLIGAGQLLCYMSIIWCIYRGLGLRTYRWVHLVTLHIMEYLSAAYAPLPGASGAQEGVFSLYFGRVFPGSTNVAAMLLWRFFTYYFSLVFGALVMVLYGLHSGKSLKESVQMTSAGEEEIGRGEE